ncbi:MAG: hypothetical protein IKQ04_02460 [Oscillospiraceae bacterium]|nr:hypothetical protein [Oscillospiraceae bacterium]
MLWAYQNQITGGVTATAFGPNKVCTRAQTVTFLYKANELLTADPLPEEPDPEPTPDPAPLEP